jgi:hypothetical protein
MKQTLKTVAVIYFFAAMTLLLNSVGWLTPPPEVHRLLSEIGVALLAVGSIHLLDHFSMIREVSSSIVSKSREMFDSASRESAAAMTAEVSKAIKKSTDTIVDDVNKRTEHAFDEASQILQRQIQSIKVMEGCNLTGIYPSRSAAGEAIRTAMEKSEEVWLMGISLNEFCREEHGPFLQCWESLVEGIKQGKKKARLLLIDPYCHGGTLRSYSETANTASVPNRLEGDVIEAAQLLSSIRSGLDEKYKANLAVRIYRMAPTTFICRLDTETFMQTYYFWNRRLPNTPIPVFRYQRREDHQTGTCIHKELEQHFNFIWDHASIRMDESEPVTEEVPAAHFLELPSTRGLEWGGHASGIENVFIDRRRPAVRMQEEIEGSKRIWIQGITLKAFFDESEIAIALRARIEGGQDRDDIRIMLLDPDCEQAKVRAYREFVLNSGQKVTLAEFTTTHYQNSKLRRDLLDTKERIENLERACGRVGIMRTYGTAPNMFVLIGDKAAFVEQYSYGKLAAQRPDKEVILGSDMPLIEYEQRIDPIYAKALRDIRGREKKTVEQLRPQPFPLLCDHFEWAWDQAQLTSSDASIAGEPGSTGVTSD